TKSRPEAAAKKKAENILKKIRGRADFAQMAKQYSDDTQSKPTGGLIPGVTPSSKLVPEFKNAALRLQKPGDLTEPVKTQFGYHIIRLEKSEMKLPTDFEKNRQKYRKEQQEQQGQAVWQQMSDKLIRDAEPSLKFKDLEF